MFARTSTSKKIVAVADVGSGSAAVALLALHAEGPAIVVAANRVALPFEERDEAATIKGIIAALSDAGDKALAGYTASPYKGSRIGSVYAVIRAPWTRSKTERASSVLKEDARITDAMIGALAQQIVADEKELDRTRLIESSVVRVELNGYPTGSPVGKYARTLSVVALMSDCDLQIRSGIGETLNRLFPGGKLVLRSGARALISAAASQNGNGRDYVILDIEGEASDIIVVREGIATEHLLISEGVRSIIKRISEKGLPEETLSLLRMMEREESESGAESAISASVARVEIDLARVYGEGFTKIAAISRVPADLVLVTHPDLAPWLTTFFSRIDFSQCTLTAQPFEVRALKSSDLAGTVTPAAGASIDIGLSIAGALVNTEDRP